jgi:hypothetical protein
MNSFSSQSAGVTAAPLDPRKHVNYVQGMVLGADDLNQEFVYHRHQGHWLARDAIGYGTLTGLQVAAGTGRNGPEISVSSGTALSPRGQLIRVVPRQCASINNWLALSETRQQLTAHGIGANDTVTVYVVLCFRDCQTDPLPVPGEPCRCDNNATAPSRVTDDFRLDLRLVAPAQREEDAVRDFVQWLRAITVTNASSGFTSIEDFLQAIRAAAYESGSPPPGPPDFLYGSPPANVVIPYSQLGEYLRAAFCLWVTELRPLWQVQWTAQAGGGCGCHGPEQAIGEGGEECLLLGAVSVPLAAWQVADVTHVKVNDGHRPFVVHLRMLQEWLLCGRSDAFGEDGLVAAGLSVVNQALSGDVRGPLNSNIVQGIQSHPVNMLVQPGLRTVLGFDATASTWRLTTLPPAPSLPQAASALPAAEQFGVAGSVGTSTDYARADHVHSMPPNQFVEHPANVGRYEIVAAGMFQVKSVNGQISVAPLGPVYNNLTATVVTPPGTFQLAFNGYNNGVTAASPSLMYIVKGSIFGTVSGDFHVLQFVSGGIQVVANASNGIIGGFMVEISLYGNI